MSSINDPGADSPLLGGDQATGPYVEPGRFWILLWYSYISGLQSLLWFTWSSVPDHSREYLDCSENTLNFFLNEGPIAFCCAVSLSAWLLMQPNGLQKSVRLGATLCLLASIVRCLPLVLDRQRHHTLVLVAVHIGQSLNAAVAPLVVASPATLSLQWFPEEERNFATAVANVSNAVGRGIGFFLGPALVHAATDLPTLLLAETAVAFLPFVATMVWYPAAPKHHPSRAAAEQDERIDRDSFSAVFKDAATMMSQPNCLALMVAGGLQMAVYGGWSGVLTAVTPQLGDSRSGTLGSVNTFAGILGGLIVGWLCDRPRLRTSLHRVIVLLSGLSFLGFLFVALALKPIDLHPFSSITFGGLLAVCAFAGLTRGGLDPLFFELVAETAHPLPAGTAGSALTLFYHLILVVFLSIPPRILDSSTLAVMAGVMALCLLMVLPVRIAYVRQGK